jgi:3-deoxy-D-manno-octulosonate 8-phosphate phosphatase (KDO 8-P phosphatase)|tara:strand:+ start:507 stop:1049 length:543 start_codon:yes stop_codon:yes gene_type:complete
MKKQSKKFIPETFILDVDGVLNTGQFLYNKSGKVMKIFGPDDNDALSLLKPYLKIIFVSGDRKGFPITKKRVVDDMKFELHLVSTIKRIDWIKEKFSPNSVIYMGDGIFDKYVFENVGYSISTANSDFSAKKAANFVTKRGGGERAVSEACLHILEKFFEPFNPKKISGSGIKVSGEWNA